MTRRMSEDKQNKDDKQNKCKIRLRWRKHQPNQRAATLRSFRISSTALIADSISSSFV
jgi:hypothetical protein